MKITANIDYPPKFEQLTLFEACKLVDALTKELLVTNQYITRLETVLEHCQQFVDARADVLDGDHGPVPNKAMQLLVEIKEVLK